MYINQEDDTTDPREQAFHNMIREHVIFLMFLILLYSTSYAMVSAYRKKREDVSLNDGLLVNACLSFATRSSTAVIYVI